MHAAVRRGQPSKVTHPECDLTRPSPDENFGGGGEREGKKKVVSSILFSFSFLLFCSLRGRGMGPANFQFFLTFYNPIKIN